MVEQVTIALTKGRIEKETLALLEKAGFDTSFMMEKGRNLIFESPDGQFRFLLVKAPDVTTYVRHGVADLGIVGKDVLIEHPTGFLEMLDLNFGRCKFSVASIPTYNPSDHKRKRIATKYPTVAMEYFNKKGEDVEIISIQGSVEIAPVLGLAVCGWVAEAIADSRSIPLPMIRTSVDCSVSRVSLNPCSRRLPTSLVHSNERSSSSDRRTT